MEPFPERRATAARQYIAAMLQAGQLTARQFSYCCAILDSSRELLRLLDNPF